jgi:hypothetical protein
MRTIVCCALIFLATLAIPAFAQPIGHDGLPINTPGGVCSDWSPCDWVDNCTGCHLTNPTGWSGYPCPTQKTTYCISCALDCVMVDTLSLSRDPRKRAQAADLILKYTMPRYPAKQGYGSVPLHPESPRPNDMARIMNAVLHIPQTDRSHAVDVRETHKLYYGVDFVKVPACTKGLGPLVVRVGRS